MNSQQLTQDVTAARIAQFGEDTGTEQFPNKYFRYDVVVTAPDGQTTPRAPRYCATDVGALDIADIASSELGYKNTIVMMPAMDLLAGWTEKPFVPWLAFGMKDNKPAGPYVNAGLLLDYYNHGYPPNRARNSCELEIIDAFVAAGLREELSEQERQEIMTKP